MDMDDVEQLDLTALGGADTMTVEDMTGPTSAWRRSTWRARWVEGTP